MLQKGRNFLSLSPLGSTITRWQYNGQDVFFPQGMVIVGSADDLKLRGGLHLCMPNFGDGPEEVAAFELPKHGPLRDTPLVNLRLGGKVADKPPYIRAQVTLPFRATKTFLHYFTTKVDISVNEKGFGHLISVSRNPETGSTLGLPLCPGLHPYFNTPRGGHAIVGRERITFGSSFESRLLPAPEDPIEIVLPGIGKVLMRPSGYKKINVWSDSPRYACVEPVLDDPDLFGTQDGHYLKAEGKLLLACDFEFIEQ